MNAGDTYRRGIGAHLWVILSDTDVFPDEIIVVNLTSYHGKSWEDATCLLSSGDHPFIRHDTRVNYAGAKATTLRELQENFTRNLIQFEDPMPAQVLKRIIDGTLISDDIPLGIQQIVQRQGRP